MHFFQTARKRNRGFTLIELLIVIAIIGVLTAVVLASLNSARAKSRDARRISDVKQIQLALENYFDNNSIFPPDIATLATNGILPSEPKDPTTNSSYFYAISTAKNQYCVGTQLEAPANTASVGTNATCSLTWSTSAPNTPSYVVIGP